MHLARLLDYLLDGENSTRLAGDRTDNKDAVVGPLLSSPRQSPKSQVTRYPHAACDSGLVLIEKNLEDKTFEFEGERWR
jgi:hypothetical protein